MIVKPVKRRHFGPVEQMDDAKSEDRAGEGK